MFSVVKKTNGNVAAMMKALQEGANVDDLSGDSDDDTGLIEAACQGNSPAVAWLLDHGANLNHNCTYSGSALMNAIRCRKNEMAKLLIDRGADVNLESYDHSTALSFAISFDNVEIATLLLNKGAKITGCKTLLMLAAYDGSLKMATLLLDSRGVDVNETNEFQQTALMFAVHRGQTEMVKLLLGRGANREIVAKGEKWSFGGQTAMDLAQEGSHASIVALLK